MKRLKLYTKSQRKPNITVPNITAIFFKFYSIHFLFLLFVS